MSHILHPIFFFFFNDTATPEISTLSLHAALPISQPPAPKGAKSNTPGVVLTSSSICPSDGWLGSRLIITGPCELLPNIGRNHIFTPTTTTPRPPSSASKHVAGTISTLPFVGPATT